MHEAVASLRVLATLSLLLKVACIGTTLPSCRVATQVTARCTALSMADTSSDFAAQLDESVPVFVITDEASQPLEYELQGRSLLMCFAGADGAQAELDRASRQNPEYDLRIQPVGLGHVLGRVRDGRAWLIPAAEDAEAARTANPDGEDWEGGALPLFGCYQLQRRRSSDGTLATPLFLSVADAKVALSTADPSRELGLHLVVTSLQSMAQLIEDGEVGAVDVVPPRRSVELCTTGALTPAARSGSVMGSIEGALPPGVTKGAIRRALPDILGDDKGLSGLFPGS